MTYKNVKTGFIFETSCEIKAEDWVKLDSQPTISEKEEEKPVKSIKRTKKNG